MRQAVRALWSPSMRERERETGTVAPEQKVEVARLDDVGVRRPPLPQHLWRTQHMPVSGVSMILVVKFTCSVARAGRGETLGVRRRAFSVTACGISLTLEHQRCGRAACALA
jgi:hypothetical protein